MAAKGNRIWLHPGRKVVQYGMKAIRKPLGFQDPGQHWVFRTQDSTGLAICSQLVTKPNSGFTTPQDTCYGLNMSCPLGNACRKLTAILKVGL
jgi:hypothetical protein